MKKILAVFSAFILCFSLCSCSESDEEKQKNFDLAKNYILNTDFSGDYYVQVSKNSSDAPVLTEASKMDDDCAFMQYDYSGAMKFYRNGKATEISAETFYVPEEKDAAWSDYSYDDMANQYEEIMKTLCTDEVLNAESEKPVVESISVSETDSKLKKYSVKYNTSAVDTKSIFKSAGNFGAISIKYTYDENSNSFSSFSINCQYDYNSEITLISVFFGTPDSPDEKGENGHRPEDIEEIFQKYLDDIEKAYNSTDSSYDYQEYLDEYNKYLNQQNQQD